jgi:hypothetical protein
MASILECGEGRIFVTHIPGHNNLADIFTKEMRDVSHFVNIRDTLVSPGILVLRGILPNFRLHGHL